MVKARFETSRCIGRSIVETVARRHLYHIVYISIQPRKTLLQLGANRLIVRITRKALHGFAHVGLLI